MCYDLIAKIKDSLVHPCVHPQSRACSSFPPEPGQVHRFHSRKSDAGSSFFKLNRDATRLSTVVWGR